MGIWDSINAINAVNPAVSSIFSSISDFPSNREAEKTNNYDRYNNEYISSQRFIMQKKETIKLVLKQDRFKTLKIKLEKMKKDI